MTASVVNTRPAAPSRSDEEQLIALAKKKDPQAWAALFDEYYPVLYRYARARLGSDEEAEDVAADAFMHALNGIGRYDYRGQPLLAWLYTITRNVVNKRWRRLSKQEQGAFGGDVAPGSEQDTVERLDLARSLGALKEEQREVVVLRLLGMSLRETARLVGKSEAAVHSLQTRAVQNLRHALRG